MLPSEPTTKYQNITSQIAKMDHNRVSHIQFASLFSVDMLCFLEQIPQEKHALQESY